MRVELRRGGSRGFAGADACPASPRGGHLGAQPGRHPDRALADATGRQTLIEAAGAAQVMPMLETAASGEHHGQ